MWATGAKMERNPYYWKIDNCGNKLPYIDNVDIKIVQNVDAAAVEIISGNIDLARRPVNPQNIPLYMQYSEKKGYKVLNPQVRLIQGDGIDYNMICKIQEALDENKFSGDNISYELDKELNKEGFNIKKIINYSSQKITNLNDENKKLIEKYPPDLIFVYSLRSAESFNEIVKEHSLSSMMTQSIVKCISKNICDFFKNAGWNKIEIFNTGDEILELEKYNK